MTTATLELYHALIDAGVPKEKAEAAAKAVITRQEANHDIYKTNRDSDDSRTGRRISGPRRFNAE